MIDGANACQLRATILGETLKQIALIRGRTTPGEILRAVLARLGRAEKEIGGDFYVALALLCRSGLVGCNTADQDNVYFNAETVLTPAKGVTSFAFEDDFAASVS